MKLEFIIQIKQSLKQFAGTRANSYCLSCRPSFSRGAMGSSRRVYYSSSKKSHRQQHINKSALLRSPGPRKVFVKEKVVDVVVDGVKD